MSSTVSKDFIHNTKLLPNFPFTKIWKEDVSQTLVMIVSSSLTLLL